MRRSNWIENKNKYKCFFTAFPSHTAIFRNYNQKERRSSREKAGPGSGMVSLVSTVSSLILLGVNESLSLIWRAGWPPDPGRSKWNAWSRESRSCQSSFPRCNARWGCTFCRIPSWYMRRCPSRCCTSPAPVLRTPQHPAASPQTCQHSWSLPSCPTWCFCRHIRRKEGVKLLSIWATPSDAPYWVPILLSALPSAQPSSICWLWWWWWNW